MEEEKKGIEKYESLFGGVAIALGLSVSQMLGGGILMSAICCGVMAGIFTIIYKFIQKNENKGE